MANIKISQLTDKATPVGTEQVPVNDSGTTKRVTLSSIISALIAGTYATVSALTSGLAGKSDTGHTHTESQITDLGDYEETANKDTANGYAGLDANGKLVPSKTSHGLDFKVSDTQPATDSLGVTLGASQADKFVWFDTGA